MGKYENSYDKSCNVKKIRYKGKTYSINKEALGKFLAQTALVIALTGVAVASVSAGIQNNKEYKNIYDIKSEYVEILFNNTHRTYNTENYWYDYEAIAKELLQNPEDFGVKFYCIYDNIGLNKENKIECMNELIQQMNFEISRSPEKYQDFDTYKNFGHFLIDNGFISTDEYENNMEEVLELKANAKEGGTVCKK